MRQQGVPRRRSDLGRRVDLVVGANQVELPPRNVVIPAALAILRHVDARLCRPSVSGARIELVCISVTDDGSFHLEDEPFVQYPAATMRAVISSTVGTSVSKVITVSSTYGR